MDRQDVAGGSGIGLDLAAQVLDVGVNGALVPLIGVALYLLQELQAGKDPARVWALYQRSSRGTQGTRSVGCLFKTASIRSFWFIR